mgnify:CR=1 FL=1
MWELALRIDGGSTRIAAENLQKTLSTAAEALKNPNLTEEQFDQIRQRLEQAVAEYMQSLMRTLDAKMRAEGMEGLPPELAEMMDNQIDAGGMMQQLQELLENGSREEIAKALSDMQKMVEQLQNTDFQPMSAEMMQTMQQTAALKEIITRQEGLLGKTLDIAPEASEGAANDPFREFAPAPETDAPDNGAVVAPLAPEQAQIEQDLRAVQSALAKGMPINTDFITSARRAMDQAVENLQKNNATAAVKAEQRALDELKKGMKETMQQMKQAMGRMINLGFAPPRRPGQAGEDGPRDPFGRPAARGQDENSGVTLSDEEERRRIQDIRDEILDKSGRIKDDPLAEDYFDKLLERF